LTLPRIKAFVGWRGYPAFKHGAGRLKSLENMINQIYSAAFMGNNCEWLVLEFS
jgi:hypothetical protein